MKLNKNEELVDQYMNINKLHSTEYDDLFKPIIKSRGKNYYTNGNIVKYKKCDNTYLADIKGTEIYKVEIEIKDNIIEKVKCTCPYHRDTDKYCKHVYALLLYIKMQNKRKEIVTLINDYKGNISKQLNEMNNVLEKNVENLYQYEVEWFKKRMENYQIKESYEKDYDKLKDFELLEILKNLYFSLNMLNYDLNELNKRIEDNKEILEKRKKENENHHIDEFNYTFDHSFIFDMIDNELASINLKTLYKIRKNLKSTGDDTELIDKAIANRKKRELSVWQNLSTIKTKKKKHLSLGHILLGSILGLSNNKRNNKNHSDYLMNWEQDEIKNGNYDKWNFEEEELEDDDYYNDDLD